MKNLDKIIATTSAFIGAICIREGFRYDKGWLEIAGAYVLIGGILYLVEQINKGDYK